MNVKIKGEILANVLKLKETPANLVLIIKGIIVVGILDGFG